VVRRFRRGKESVSQKERKKNIQLSGGGTKKGKGLPSEKKRRLQCEKTGTSLIKSKTGGDGEKKEGCPNPSRGSSEKGKNNIKENIKNI